jgi:hypothetical protein
MGILKDEISDLASTFRQTMIDILLPEVVEKALKKIAAAGTPLLGVVEFAMMAYNTVEFLINRFNSMLELIDGIVQSFENMARNAVIPAANKVESALGNALPLALEYLISLAGLTTIVDKIKKGLKKVTDVIESAIKKFADSIAEIIKSMMGKVREMIGKAKAKVANLLKGRPDRPGEETPVLPTNKQSLLDAGLRAIDEEHDAKMADGEVTEKEANDIVKKVWKNHRIFKSLEVVGLGDEWVYKYRASPQDKKVKSKKSKSQKPSTKYLGTQINTKKVEELLNEGYSFGRKTKLPPDYVIYRKGRKKKSTLDALHIDKQSFLQKGLTPQNQPGRNGELTAALDNAGVKKKDYYQDHHLVPLQTVNSHPLFIEAKTRIIPYNPNTKNNGIRLPGFEEVAYEYGDGGKLPIHNGYHKRYNGIASEVANRQFQRIKNINTLNDKNLLRYCSEVEDEMRTLVIHWNDAMDCDFLN